MTDVLERNDQIAEADHDAHDDHHPSNATYWKVGLFLAVVTALEIVAYEMIEGPLATAALLIMMVVKFIVVVGMFMHLRFDNKLLRNLFLIGIFLASTCYLGAFAAMGHFEDSGTNVIRDVPADQPMPPQPTAPAPIIKESKGH